MITQPSGMVDVVHLELQLDDLFFFSGNNSQAHDAPFKVWGDWQRAL